MAGIKRSHDGLKSEIKPGFKSPYLPMFESFRAELDEHHDRRERVIKASRDITAQSKKVIFTLQRARTLGAPLPQSIANSNEPMLATIKVLFTSAQLDLEGINAYRYQRNISGGIQEYMEAVLFQHYLETERIMPLGKAAKQMSENALLTYDDYALGLFDVTGELMRFAITYLATNGSLPEPSGAEEGGASQSSILTDMQLLRSLFETLDARSSFALARDWDQKLKITKSSVEKVEYGVYSMRVRGKERPKGWRPDAALADGPGQEDRLEAY